MEVKKALLLCSKLTDSISLSNSEKEKDKKNETVHEELR